MNSYQNLLDLFRNLKKNIIYGISDKNFEILQSKITIALKAQSPSLLHNYRIFDLLRDTIVDGSVSVLKDQISVFAILFGYMFWGNQKSNATDSIQNTPGRAVEVTNLTVYEQF